MSSQPRKSHIETCTLSNGTAFPEFDDLHRDTPNAGRYGSDRLNTRQACDQVLTMAWSGIGYITHAGLAAAWCIMQPIAEIGRA